METDLPHGYDTSEVFREDTFLGIKCLQSEANDCAKRMNEIIKKEHLLEELVEVPFPEDNDPDCE